MEGVLSRLNLDTGEPIDIQIILLDVLQKKHVCTLRIFLISFRGGNFPNQIDFTGTCKEGYKGKACSDCEHGWAKFGGFIINISFNLIAGNDCRNCKEDISYYLKMVIYFGIILFSIYLQIRYQ